MRMIPSAAVVTATAAVVAAVGVWAWPWVLGRAFGRGLGEVTHAVSETAGPSIHQIMCARYSEFVLTEAHNGYTVDQIQRVIDFAGSHAKTPAAPAPDAPVAPPPGEPPSAPPPAAGETGTPLPAPTSAVPSTRQRTPSISDETACGTPAQILEAAGVPH